jgi:hypothetical protein
MKGDLYDFLVALGKRESGNDYKIKNEWGFMGRWQFGEMRLYDLGISIDGWHPIDRPQKKVITSEQFRSDSLLQDMAVLKHIRLLKNHYSKHPQLETEVNGIKITLSGLVASAHLKGTGGVKDFLNGKDNSDALGTMVSEYMKLFSEYNLVE